MVSRSACIFGLWPIIREVPAWLYTRSLQRLNFLPQEGLFQRLFDDGAQFIDLEGLGNVVIGPLPHGLDRRIHTGIAGNDHHLGGRPEFFGLGKNRHAVQSLSSVNR